MAVPFEPPRLQKEEEVIHDVVPSSSLTLAADAKGTVAVLARAVPCDCSA